MLYLEIKKTYIISFDFGFGTKLGYRQTTLKIIIMKTEKLNIIETLFTIKFDKELQAILQQDLEAYKQRNTQKKQHINIQVAA
ncbi:MAG: hypothetical protein NVSMB24_04610 [Mucilaginibacter sp.]